MNNKNYLDTLEMCGVLKSERLGEKYVDIICPSELDIGSLIKICSTYKKFNELEKCLRILGHMMGDLKKVEELKDIYDRFVDILEIYFKNEIEYFDKFNKDVLSSLYIKVRFIRKSKYPYEGYKDVLNDYRYINVKVNKLNKAKIDNVKCKILLENYGNYLTVFAYNYNLIREEVTLIRFDRKGAKIFGKEDLKIKDISELKYMLSQNKDSVYMVGI